MYHILLYLQFSVDSLEKILGKTIVNTDHFFDLVASVDIGENSYKFPHSNYTTNTNHTCEDSRQDQQ